MMKPYHILVLSAALFSLAACACQSDTEGEGGAPMGGTSTSSGGDAGPSDDAAPDVAPPPDGPAVFACKFSSDCLTELCCHGACLAPGSPCPPQ